MKTKVIQFLFWLIGKIDKNVASAIRTALNKEEKTIEKTVVITSKDIRDYNQDRQLHSYKLAEQEVEQKSKDFVLNKLVEEALERGIIELAVVEKLGARKRVRGKLHYKIDK